MVSEIIGALWGALDIILEFFDNKGKPRWWFIALVIFLISALVAVYFLTR